MTLSDIESRTGPENEATRSSYLLRHVSPDSPAFTEWLKARHDFMRQKGWLTGDETDLDVYDANPHTEQMAVYDDENTLVFGMRLTPVGGYKEALSWDMVQHSDIPGQVTRSDLLKPDHPVWDLTRLVPGKGATLRSSYQAIPRLFGEGLRYCARQGDEDPVWVFVLDGAMEKWLLRQGVEVTVLGTGKVNSDKETSLFGYFEPAKLAALQESHDFARRAMGQD